MTLKRPDLTNAGSSLLAPHAERVSAMAARKTLMLATVVLLVAVLASFFAFLWSGPSISREPETVRISMTTFNWGFNTTDIASFQPGTIHENPTITAHKGQRVIIELRTLDITHGFAIDEYDIRVYIPPGETVTVNFIADREGTFTYYCNVFCGVGHAHMRGIFQVVP